MLLALVFISQLGAGSLSGLDCANAKPLPFYLAPANWGAGRAIAPGSTVHVCGTISSLMAAQGNGMPGAPIIITFEPGAKLSRPADPLISLFQRHDFVLDCHGGAIENTDNGSERQFRKSVIALNLTGADRIEVKNCHFKDIYVHTLASDHSIDLGAGGAIYMPVAGSGISITGNTFENVGWGINAVAQRKDSTGLSIRDNDFRNYDHGIAGLGSVGGAGGCSIVGNKFGSTANWDTSTNTYHHNAIHVFGHKGWSLTSCLIENNIFDGDFGRNNTAHIFMECDDTRTNPDACSNITISGNRFIQAPNNPLSNGFALGGGPGWQWLNNVFLGSGVTNQIGVGLRRGGTVFRGNTISGVRTFVSSPAGQTFATSGLSGNLYLQQATGTQPAFVYAGTPITSLGAWQKATGQDGGTAR